MAKRRLDIADLFEIGIVADPNISPDGQRVAFVVTHLRQKENDYTSAIWLADRSSGEVYQYTAGRGQGHSPRWSPDGRHLAFISNRSGSGQIHLMAADGGEAWQLTSGTNAPSDPVWSADSSAIYYVSKVDQENPPKSDTFVTRDLLHKLDGEGFWDGKFRQIHRISVDGGEAQQITDGDWHSTQPAISPDGTRLAFCSYRENDRRATTRMDLWTLELASGDLERLTPGDGFYGAPAWSADSSKLAYMGNPTTEAPYGPTLLTDIYIRSIDSGDVQQLFEGQEVEPGSSSMSDIRFHVPAQRPIWNQDGSAIYSLISSRGSVKLASCALDGNVEYLVDGEVDVLSFTLAGSGEIAYCSTTFNVPPEIFVVDAEGDSKQLSQINQAWLEQVELAGVEEVEFESDSGVMVHGWLLKPPSINESARYPAVLQVHGGPHGMYGVGFFHEMQLLAARGYVVLMTNPRGSTGYGQEWVAGTIGDWGGKDYRDVLAAAEFLGALPYVDEQRLGITGGSYGGYMVNWVIGQSSLFKGAVSQRSTANRASLYGTSDLNWSYNDWEYDGSPYENPEHYVERSPITYVANVETPVLLLASENDLRCPISQSEEYFTALKKHDKCVEFVRFPNESHGLSRGGQPVHRVERLERICGWFDQYL